MEPGEGDRGAVDAARLCDLAHGVDGRVVGVLSVGEQSIVDRHRRATGELRTAIVTWIERTDRRRGRHDSLGRPTPIDFEAIVTEPATQAA